MTSFSDEQPLSRRQRRERLRAQQAHDSVLQSQKPQGDEPGASTPPPEGAPAEKPETPLASASDGSSTENADETSTPANTAAKPSAAPSAPSVEAPGRPLTRRELRALRAETGQTQIVTPTGLQNAEESPLSAPKSARSTTESTPASDDTATPRPDPGQGEPGAVATSAPEKKSKAAKKAAQAQKAGKADAATKSDTPAPSAASSGVPRAETPTEDPQSAASANDSSEQGNKLPPAFGTGVRDGEGAARAFDTLVAPEARGSDAFTTSSVLILPGAPSKPTQSPVPGSDGPLVTGSVDLPRSKARDRQSGAERSDVDTGRDNGADTTATAGTPVSATKAVSTHAVTRDVITPPTKASSSKLLMILAITAGVLCVAVIGVVIVGLMTGSF